MEIINSLTSILETGSVPEGYDEKVLKKLSKKFQTLENRRVVHLYPLRNVTYDDCIYCVYACPISGKELDESIIQQIKAQVDGLDVGHIRYNSVMTSGYSYYIIDPNTGKYIVDKEDDLDAVKALSNCFDGVLLFSNMFTSLKKAPQLDCHYAIVGIEKQPNGHEIAAIPNNVIGQAPSKRRGEIQCSGLGALSSSEEEEAPAFEKYKSAMTVLSVIITIAVLVWYFFLR